MDEVISESPFDWCGSGDHANCKREYKESYTDPRSNKNVYTGKVRKCGCKKRGCKCYTAPAERPKKQAKRKK